MISKDIIVIYNLPADAARANPAFSSCMPNLNARSASPVAVDMEVEE